MQGNVVGSPFGGINWPKAKLIALGRWRMPGRSPERELHNPCADLPAPDVLHGPKCMCQDCGKYRVRDQAARRLEQQEREWVARLERLIVDEIFPYRVDQVEHAKEMRFVAHMIMAGR